MKKVVIIGCGAVAYRWYFKGIKDSDYCEIAALVDPDKAALKKAGQFLNTNKLYINLKDFFDSKVKADIALVLTRHKLHFDLIKDCLINGLNVYSEKPFASNYLDAKYLLNLAKDKKLVLASAPQVKLSSRNQKVKQILDSGVLGKIALVRATGSNMGPAGRKDTNYDPRWFYNDGGSLASLGIYTLSLVTYLFGEPNRVASYFGTAFPHRTVRFGPEKGKLFNVSAPDNQIAILDYGCGTFVMFDGSYTVNNPMKNELVIHGELGTLYVRGFGGKNSIIFKKDNLEKEMGPDDNCHLKWNLFWGVDNLAKYLDNKEKLIVTGDFASKVIKIMDAMKKSNDENRMIKCKEN